MKRWQMLVLVIASVALVVGCHRRSHHSTFQDRKSDGIVEKLTGDNDDEVSDDLEDMVYDANKQGVQDEPLDF